MWINKSFKNVFLKIKKVFKYKPVDFLSQIRNLKFHVLEKQSSHETVCERVMDNKTNTTYSGEGVPAA